MDTNRVYANQSQRCVKRGMKLGGKGSRKKRRIRKKQLPKKRKILEVNDNVPVEPGVTMQPNNALLPTHGIDNKNKKLNVNGVKHLLQDKQMERRRRLSRRDFIRMSDELWPSLLNLSQTSKKQKLTKKSETIYDANYEECDRKTTNAKCKAHSHKHKCVKESPQVKPKYIDTNKVRAISPQLNDHLVESSSEMHREKNITKKVQLLKNKDLAPPWNTTQLEQEPFKQVPEYKTELEENIVQLGRLRSLKRKTPRKKRRKRQNLSVLIDLTVVDKQPKQCINIIEKKSKINDKFECKQDALDIVSHKRVKTVKMFTRLDKPVDISAPLVDREKRRDYYDSDIDFILERLDLFKYKSVFQAMCISKKMMRTWILRMVDIKETG